MDTKRSPLQLGFADQENSSVGSLSRIINRVRHHECSKKYCQRKERATVRVSYRFHFPYDLMYQARVAKPPGHQRYRFFPPRNDRMINGWNRVVIISWLANIDMTPCTGSKALLDYIAKYASNKAEKKTESYKEMMKNILPTLNNRHSLLSAVTKMMNL